MHKGYMFSKYALDKDLKDVGGLWSRVDFRDYIITPKNGSRPAVSCSGLPKGCAGKGNV